MGGSLCTTSEVTLTKQDTPLNIKPEQINPKFADMPEWEGERYRGVGIKQMKGYKCTLPIDELYKLREEFWNWRLKDKIIWRHLRQACIMDDGNTILYIN